MKFKTKLYLSFGVLIFSLIIFFGIVINILDRQTQNMNEIVRERYEAVKIVSIIQNETNNSGRLLRSKILDPDGDIENEENDSFDESRRRVSQAIENFHYHAENKELEDLVIRLKNLNQSYTKAGKTVLDLVNLGKQDEATKLILSKNVETRLDLLGTAERLRKSQENEMEKVIETSVEIYERDIKSIILISAFIMLLGMGIMFLATKSVSGSLRKITAVINNINYDSIENLPRLDIYSKDEIGEIAQAFNEMAKILEDKAQSEKEFNEFLQGEKWLKTQIVEFTTMYQGVNDIKTLAELFLGKIAPLVGLGYGVFYLGHKGEQCLTKLATYAHNKQHLKIGTIPFGEGLVGQCALDNKILIMEQVREDFYIKITSGLGDTIPYSLAIFPVAFEGKVIAVIELATFYPFKPQEIRLLEEIISNLGVTLKSIISYMEVERLLDEAQTLTEELQTQSEELIVQQEELRSINEKLEEQYRDSDQKTRELEQIKEALEKQNRQVLLSSKYKTEFLANMSHELRTPLNSLLILGQMLAENQDKNLTGKQVEYANTICSSGKDLLYLIDEILDLSKVEAGKVHINYGDVELSEVQAHIESQFSALASSKGLELKFKLESDLPLSISTDAHRLNQILKNLLSNAFKFTERGSITLTIYVKDTFVAFEVTDTGIGIPKQNQNIIFEAFQQGDGTTGRKYGGTGLGLSISRELAYLLGGFIEVESVEGEGSTFSLYLPNQCLVKTPVIANFEMEVATANEDILELDQLDIDVLNGKKVLIVDDDMRNIYALTTALEAKAIEVLFAENGRSALTILQENIDINLVLMDIMMPEMDGYQSMQEIRSNPSFQSLPIIALTAKAMKLDREKCIAAGASDYISKPVKLEQLFSLMRVWLN